MKANYLNDADHDDIHRLSSIDQYHNFISILVGGKEVPISFDSLDWINCDGIKSHRSIVSDGDDIGYNFPIGHYTYFTDTYIVMDRNEVVVKKLPEWYGKGWYEKALNERDFINFDGCSFGHRDKVDLRIGYDYIITDEVLDDSDDE